jgi:hypothetical protein
MRITVNGKVRRSVAEWRTLCERFDQSGLEVAEFCRREKLAVSSFQQWYPRCTGGAVHAAHFVELGPPPGAAGRWELEVELPNGARIRLRG